MLMFKRSTTSALLLLSGSYLFGQQFNVDDYKIYSSLIQTEIRDTAKSIAIIKIGISYQELKGNTGTIADAIKSGDSNSIYQICRWTENNAGKKPTCIDSISQEIVLDYTDNKFADFVIMDQVSSSAKIILLKDFPIRTKSIDNDWKNFYKKYPGSGGIFSLSRIMYTPDEMTAILYYWHRLNGLNGHGALAIMEKTGAEWKIKYKIYLWWS